MFVPLVDLNAQYRSIKPDIDAAIQRVLGHTNFILGEEVANFEQAFAAYVCAKEAVGVASGTASLYLALLACGVGPGDEVITTPHTFVATAEAILQAGAQPVFVDIDLSTYTIDPNRVEEAITPRTRAIIPVHLYGQPAEMEALSEIAQHHNLWLIEDAAQAHGARYRGRMVGTIGSAGCFSFYPAKNLGAYGDAGAVVSQDPAITNAVRLLRDHGRRGKYQHEVRGFNHRMDSIQAAVLNVKLRHLEDWNERRRAIAARYREELDGVVELPQERPDCVSSYYMFVIRTPHRDKLQAFLRERGIETGIHYPVPLHLQPAFSFLKYQVGQFPAAEQAAKQVLSLPIYPEMTDEQVGLVIDQVLAFFKFG